MAGINECRLAVMTRTTGSRNWGCLNPPSWLTAATATPKYGSAASSSTVVTVASLAGIAHN